MEVFYNGEWGTVCDAGWDLNDAQVVCRQLGFAPPIAAIRFAHFGQGSGEIWLDNVECVGNELTIESCSHSGWGNGDCGHHRNAGVECGRGMYNF